MDPRTKILDHVSLTAFEDIPQDAWSCATKFIADTIGVGLAGSTAQGSDALVSAALGWGKGDLPVLGRAVRVPKPSVALLNGFFIHNLEWDAVHEPAVVHAMSTITAACLAEAAANPDISGQALVAAILLGVDVSAGLGVATKAGLTFFRPATAGAMGAALSVARLRGLDRERFDDVFGLAYSQLSGTMQAHVEGSITLPLQVAIAARTAITAVDMAEAGLTGPHDVLDGPFGYFKLFEQGGAAQEIADRIGKIWSVTELAHKPYPSGRASHAVLEYVLRQVRENELNLDAVRSIKATVPPLIHRLVARPYKPGLSAAYARLCLPYLCGLAVRDGIVSPDAGDDQNLSDPQLAAFAERVSIVHSDVTDPNAMSPQHCAIILEDGRTLESNIPDIYGGPNFPLDREAQRAKFDLAASFAHIKFTPEQIKSLREMAFGLDKAQSVTGLFDLMHTH